MAGLRETKKAQMRGHISDTATALFADRGFDEVTVAEVAEAAGVSKMTVFNYFPRKEDLLLDRLPEAHDLLARAIHDRPAGTSALAGLRRAALDLVDHEHPLSGARPGTAPFVRLVAGSPALVARGREAAEELEHALARLLAAEEPDDGDPHLRAALVMAVLRTSFLRGLREVLAGRDAPELGVGQRAHLEQGFDALEHAFAGLSSRA